MLPVVLRGDLVRMVGHVGVEIARGPHVALILLAVREFDAVFGRRVAELNDLLKLVENTHIEETSLVNTTRGAKYRVRAINAAVLDATGYAVMAIQLGPFEKSLSATTVKRIGERLRRAVDEISAMLGSGSAESRAR